VLDVATQSLAASPPRHLASSHSLQRDPTSLCCSNPCVMLRPHKLNEFSVICGFRCGTHIAVALIREDPYITAQEAKRNVLHGPRLLGYWCGPVIAAPCRRKV